ncbi:hypothetical protein RB195_017797 [Necator americanus]|uniref:Uncharacterized protein n=1 Tax=Necator americanus TaxID=51031 RepID=A0ABR1C8M5_NECAM
MKARKQGECSSCESPTLSQQPARSIGCRCATPRRSSASCPVSYDLEQINLAYFNQGCPGNYMWATPNIFN